AVQRPGIVRHVDRVPGRQRDDARHVVRGVIVHAGGEREGRSRAQGRGDQTERAVADEGGGTVGRVGGAQDERRVLGGQRNRQQKQQRASHRDHSVSDGWLTQSHAAVETRRTV